MRIALLSLVCLTASWTSVQGYIAAPLVGYQQGVKLIILPSESTNDQCTVYGVPTPWGHVQSAPTPLYLYTPKGTGKHVLEFNYNTTAYTLSPFLGPGQTVLQIDTTDPKNFLISFDSTNSPQGESGYVTVVLSNSTTGAPLCTSQIQLYVDYPTPCVPYYGGVYYPGVVADNNPPPVIGSDGGAVITVPKSIQIYAPTFVQQTIINQYISITNVQITNIINNVNQVQDDTISKAIEPTVPPTKDPVNCTTSPTNSACTVSSGQPPSNSPPPVTATPPAAVVAGSPSPPVVAPPNLSPFAQGAPPPSVIVTGANPPASAVVTGANPPASAIVTGAVTGANPPAANPPAGAQPPAGASGASSSSSPAAAPSAG